MTVGDEGPQARTSSGGDGPLALVYTRVSTLPQQEHSRGLDQQLEKIEDYCQENGYRLDDRHVYTDIVSGTHQDRSGFYDLLAAIESQAGDVVLAYDVDRFGRNLKDNAFLLSEAEDAELRVETVTGRQDYLESAEGEFLFGIMSLMSQYVNQKRSSRLSRGRDDCAREGYWAAGPPPAGYDSEGEQGRKVLIPNEGAPYVRDLFERYAREGVSQRDLMEWSRSVQGEEGGDELPVSQGALGKILRKRVYRGRIEWKGETYMGRHAPIVSRELWVQVQEKRGAKDEKYSSWGRGD